MENKVVPLKKAPQRNLLQNVFWSKKHNYHCNKDEFMQEHNDQTSVQNSLTLEHAYSFCRCIY